MGAPIDSNKLRQIFFLILLVALGYLLFYEMKGFIPAFLGALTFYMLMRKKNRELIYRRHMKPGLSALLLIFLSFLIILVPVYTFGAMISGKISYALSHSNELIAKAQQLVGGLEKTYHVKILTPQNVQKVGNSVAGFLPNLLGATFDSLTTIGIMYFILYFMLIKSVELERWLYRFLPLHNQNIAMVGNNLDELVKSNAIGMPVIAVIQGAVALVGYYIAGVEDPWFWFVITAIASMVPFVGAALGYIPAGLTMLMSDNGGGSWQPYFVMGWGLIVVGSVDNIFRMWFQKKIGDVHPLITIFGVVIGVQMFGFIGLIFGPILISLFLLLVSVYVDEFGTLESAQDYPTEEDVPPSKEEVKGKEPITAKEDDKNLEKETKKADKSAGGGDKKTIDLKEEKKEDNEEK